MDRENWLAAAFVELADTSAAEFDEARYACAFTGRLAELLSPAEIGMLIPAEGNRTAVPTGSSARAAELVRLEANGTAGPAIDCYHRGQAARNESIAAAGTRWPEFAAAALAAGFGFVSTLSARHQDETVGVVCVLSTSDRPLAAAEISLARQLAEAAAISIRQQRALQRSHQISRQLRHALDSRVVIEQAKGAVAAWLSVTPGEAFELLRGYARRRSRRLADVCGDVVRGTIAARDLAASAATARRRGEAR